MMFQSKINDSDGDETSKEREMLVITENKNSIDWCICTPEWQGVGRVERGLPLTDEPINTLESQIFTDRQRIAPKNNKQYGRPNFELLRGQGPMFNLQIVHGNKKVEASTWQDVCDILLHPTTVIVIRDIEKQARRQLENSMLIDEGFRQVNGFGFTMRTREDLMER